VILVVPPLLLTPTFAAVDRNVEVLQLPLTDRHFAAAAAAVVGVADTEDDEKNPPPALAVPPNGPDGLEVICCRLRRRKGTVRPTREVIVLQTLVDSTVI